jgi:3-phosphoshikimate 1-carboxyvinyltransferase
MRGGGPPLEGAGRRGGTDPTRTAFVRRSRGARPDPPVGRSAPLVGTLRVPGDKSISHRALILATLARGRSEVTEVNLGRDVRATARALTRLGGDLRVDAANARVEVEGIGWDGLHEPDAVLDAGNSGTTLRSLLGVCAAVPGGFVLTGDRTLRRRPMDRVVAPLRAMGATIDGRAGGRLPPLWVRGEKLAAIDWHTTVASAQVKTALLLAGLRAQGRTSVTEPARSRDHTERMMSAAGISLERSGTTVAVVGGQELRAVHHRIPGDVSAAAFLAVAATLVPGSDLEIAEVGLNPTRTGAFDALVAMGANLVPVLERELSGEPVGRVRVRAAPLAATAIEGPAVPTLIDEIPVLAVAATQARGATVFRDAAELRVKESDRIDCLARGLRVLGADVEPLPDGLVVRGPTPLRGGTVESRGDHRIALAFAVAGLVAADPVDIRGWECVATSFPTWDEVLAEARQGPR